MPKIIPIRDLKDTAAISKLCNESQEPIFVTKNGYGDMVIMSFDTYEKLASRAGRRTFDKCEGEDGE